jgi:hypothetical protein
MMLILQDLSNFVDGGGMHLWNIRDYAHIYTLERPKGRINIIIESSERSQLPDFFLWPWTQ